jgi:hypothetical protein
LLTLGPEELLCKGGMLRNSRLNIIANETQELQLLTLLPFINIVSLYINFDTSFALRYSIGQLLYPLLLLNKNKYSCIQHMKLTIVDNKEMRTESHK